MGHREMTTLDALEAVMDVYDENPTEKARRAVEKVARQTALIQGAGELFRYGGLTQATRREFVALGMEELLAQIA